MKRVCVNPLCKESFEVTDDDLAFIDHVSPIVGGKKQLIPPPTLCPECRLQRRLAFRCPIFVFRRTGWPTGETIFSMFPEDTPFPVMRNEYWHGNEWDSDQFAEDISWDTPCFEQFRAFRMKARCRLLVWKLKKEAEHLRQKFLPFFERTKRKV